MAVSTESLRQLKTNTKSVVAVGEARQRVCAFADSMKAEVSATAAFFSSEVFVMRLSCGFLSP